MAKITIRGIYGWNNRDRDAQLEKGLPEELDTPEKRLEAIQKAVREGGIEFAPEERGGFVIQWAKEDFGFGELTVAMREDGSISIDDEACSRATLREILLAVLDQGTTLSEEEDKKPRA